MAETNTKVMALVEKEIRKNPEVTNEELFEKARKVDKGVASLSRRQFHARYPLQVRRGRSLSRTAEPQREEVAPKAAKEVVVRNAAGADRAAVRRVLVQFARDVAAAEAKADVLAVIGEVDKYVDRVVKATAER